MARMASSAVATNMGLLFWEHTTDVGTPCVLHGLDAESYLADVIRVLPYWPRARYLELAPKYWARTRARLDQAELDRPIGRVTVPPLAAEEQPSTD